MKSAMLMVGAIAIGYIVYFTISTGNMSFPALILPVICGLTYENLRIGTSWSTLGWKLAISMFFGCIAFLTPLLGGPPDIDQNINSYVKVFLGVFLISSVINHGDRVFARLTEGTTMILSLSMVYWIVDQWSIVRGSMFLTTLVGVVFLLSAFSLFNALTCFILKPLVRFILSIWSSIVILALAIDHGILALFSDPFFERGDPSSFADILSYFLLGISLMYLAQNALMLLPYLPDRDWFKYQNSYSEINEANTTHINRYSDQQMNIVNALLSASLVCAVYYLNFVMNFLPRQTMIWLTLWSVPLLFGLKSRFLHGRR